MERIQIITIIVNFFFLLSIAYLIVKGKLREEYAIVWLVCTLFLGIFSIWRNGLEVFSRLFGVYEAPNLVFTGFIFIILVYLLHLSIVNSKLQKNMTKLAQEIALLKQENEENAKKESSTEPMSD
ncbi:DUF2304 domain-containing protein [Emticicia sp. BO119]|uniref:DUF2304 domain-containing protein n=1 Tax=Emticicia sp. BO119 TaxID=2757768 RepID=UPI0015F05AD1|nr:DUF2304 domain-containing protein [Emticicia sp. BO119]MBA4853246.1 DUF2304 domain-containing protein [Emticicia sp. BO119]